MEVGLLLGAHTRPCHLLKIVCSKSMQWCWCTGRLEFHTKLSIEGLPEEPHAVNLAADDSPLVVTVTASKLYLLLWWHINLFSMKQLLIYHHRCTQSWRSWFNYYFCVHGMTYRQVCIDLFRQFWLLDYRVSLNDTYITLPKMIANLTVQNIYSRHRIPYEKEDFISNLRINKSLDGSNLLPLYRSTVASRYSTLTHTRSIKEKKY
jgi:hypothetical protein